MQGCAAVSVNRPGPATPLPPRTLARLRRGRHYLILEIADSDSDEQQRAITDTFGRNYDDIYDYFTARKNQKGNLRLVFATRTGSQVPSWVKGGLGLLPSAPRVSSGRQIVCLGILRAMQL